MSKTKLERMAEDYEKPLFISQFDGYDSTPSEAFIAGFRAAREMAAKYTSLYYLQEEESIVPLHKRISQLGEEQMDE